MGRVLRGTWTGIFIFSLSIMLVVIASRKQPPSNRLTMLHLLDCQPPCWLGITPGKSTWNDAQQRIKDIYGSTPSYIVEQKLDDSSVLTYKISLRNDPQTQFVVSFVSSETGMSPKLNEIEHTPIVTIALAPIFSSAWGYLSLADIYASYGKPSGVIVPTNYSIFYVAYGQQRHELLIPITLRNPRYSNEKLRLFDNELVTTLMFYSYLDIPNDIWRQWKGFAVLRQRYLPVQ